MFSPFSKSSFEVSSCTFDKDIGKEMGDRTGEVMATFLKSACLFHLKKSKNNKQTGF